MKILHVITMLDIGGAERLIVDLLPRLRDLGHEVDLLLFNGVDTLFKSELERQGINIYELSHGHDVNDFLFKVYNPWNIVKIRKYLNRYDIIHTHNTACQLYVPISKSLGLNKKPFLVTTEHSSNNRRRSIWWYKPIDKWMYNRYTSIVCIADKPRENLERYIGAKPSILTISNGVDTHRFNRPIKDISNNTCFVITMVAGLRAEKDHETLIKAMAHLPEKYSLRLVGSGEREKRLKALVDELDLNSRVAFLGVRMDVPDILAQSDINVLSSHWEGLSLSSVEGMASGRPFVASDVDGLREIVSGAGILFPHGDDKALAREIQNLCENPVLYRSIALACQERARKYDVSVMAEKYSNLYKLLGRKPLC